MFVFVGSGKQVPVLIFFSMFSDCKFLLQMTPYFINGSKKIYCPFTWQIKGGTIVVVYKFTIKPSFFPICQRRNFNVNKDMKFMFGVFIKKTPNCEIKVNN